MFYIHNLNLNPPPSLIAIKCKQKMLIYKQKIINTFVCFCFCFFFLTSMIKFKIYLFFLFKEMFLFLFSLNRSSQFDFISLNSFVLNFLKRQNAYNAFKQSLKKILFSVLFFFLLFLYFLKVF